MASEPPIAAEDRALIERVAQRIVELHLEVPAILTLESARPVTLLASQAMIFFEPLVQPLLGFGDYRRFAALIERREVLEAMVAAIEERSDREREARRPARHAPPPGGSPRA
jgi:hypothetical protein